MAGHETYSAPTSLVSIITATYNCAQYIREAVDSVRGQTYPHWEMIIVDDGSTDHTGDLFELYKSDPRIQYCYRENRGQSAARNYALSLARGEFICFLDADDKWLPDKLEKSLAVFDEHPDVHVVYGDMISIDQYGQEISRYNMRRYSGRICKYLLRDNCVSFSTAMARRRCFDEMGGQNEEYRRAPDWDLWLRFSTRFNFYYIPEYLTYYRIRPGQISGDVDGRLKVNELIMRRFLLQNPDLLSPAEVRETWCYFFTRKGRAYAQMGKLSEAFTSYVYAVCCDPWKENPWRALAKLILLQRG